MNNLKLMSNLKLINKLNQNKSPGPCSIPVKILQNHVEIIVNLSFQQGVSPEAFISLKKNSFNFLNFLLIIVPSLFCQFLANWMKNVCILIHLSKYKLLFKSNLVMKLKLSSSYLDLLGIIYHVNQTSG